MGARTKKDRKKETGAVPNASLAFGTALRVFRDGSPELILSAFRQVAEGSRFFDAVFE
jgi:hypothetical protein